MIKKLLTATLITTLAVTAHAGKLTPNQTFQNPDKQLEVKGADAFKKSDTILLPGIFLQTLAEGRHTQSKGGSHAKATYAITNLSPQQGEEMATEIYNDLVSKLKASGWKVLTYEDTKSNPAWAKLKTAENLKDIGTPGFTGNYGYGPIVWMTSHPANGFKAEIAGGGLAPGHNLWNKVAKPLNANLLFPVIRFDAPVAFGSSDRGYSSVSSSAGVIPAMNLSFISAGIIGAKGAWGSAEFRGGMRVSENVGEITVANQSSSKDISLFNFETFRSISKGDYLMTLNEDEYRKTIMQVATDYNTLLVESLKEALPKKK
jgi:hypothetical protein